MRRKSRIGILLIIKSTGAIIVILIFKETEFIIVIKV